MEREGDLRLSFLHEALELFRPADTAHEIDAFVRARVADSQDRSEKRVLKDAHVELGDRGSRLRAGFRPEAEPPCAEIHRELSALRIIRGVVPHIEALPHFGKKSF